VGRPVIFEWKYTPYSSHVMVAVDVFLEKASQKVLVNDSGPASCRGATHAIDYAFFVEASTASGMLYTHGTDYFELMPSPSPTPTCPKATPNASPCATLPPTKHLVQDAEDREELAREVNLFLGELKPEWLPRLGIETPPGKTLGVGESIDVYTLRLDYQVLQGAPFDSLLFPPQPEARDYTAVDDGDIVTIATTYLTSGGWVVAKVGSNPVTRDALELRRGLAASRSLAPERFSLVNVPVSNDSYLLFEQDGRFLVPLQDDPDFAAKCGGVVRGNAVPVGCLFPLLISRAQRHNGLPS
jgi:hypothetical protein